MLGQNLEAVRSKMPLVHNITNYVTVNDVANALLGLTQQQLLSPITTMEQLHYTGMRLIPYRAVGQPNGMLLAMKMDEVTAGKERIGKIVAFAPQCIGSKSYQALIGGAI